MSIFVCMLMNIDIYTNHIREIIHESIRKLEPHVLMYNLKQGEQVGIVSLAYTIISKEN